MIYRDSFTVNQLYHYTEMVPSDKAKPLCALPLLRASELAWSFPGFLPLTFPKQKNQGDIPGISFLTELSIKTVFSGVTVTP